MITSKSISRLLFFSAFIFSLQSLTAQKAASSQIEKKRLPHPELENPLFLSINKEQPHATFMTYSNRDAAIADVKEKSQWYIPLNGDWKFNFEEPEGVSRETGLRAPSHRPRRPRAARKR